MATQNLTSTSLTDPLPKWLQISIALEHEIEERMETGDLRLPTEAELCAAYSVSLVTVRQALQSLESRGLITRKRKRGTFVSPDAFSWREELSVGQFDDLVRSSKSDEYELVFAEVVPVPASMASRFDGQMNVMKLIQRRLSGDRPIGFTTDYVKLDYAGKIELSLLSTCNLWQLLMQHTDIEVASIRQKFRAKNAWQEIAHELQVPLMSPIMVYYTECFSESGDLISSGTNVFPGDVVEMMVEVSAQGSPNLD